MVTQIICKTLEKIVIAKKRKKTIWKINATQQKIIVR